MATIERPYSFSNIYFCVSIYLNANFTLHLHQGMAVLNNKSEFGNHKTSQTDFDSTKKKYKTNVESPQFR